MIYELAHECFSLPRTNRALQIQPSNKTGLYQAGPDNYQTPTLPSHRTVARRFRNILEYIILFVTVNHPLEIIQRLIC